MKNGGRTTDITGRWKSALTALGINERVLDGNHHPCPVSGEGEDRFRFSNKKGKGNFFCACNDGRSDGFKLLECMFGWDFKTAITKIEEIFGETREDDDPNKGRDMEQVLKDLRAIQSKIVTRKADVLTRMHLVGRGIDVDTVYRPGVLHDALINYGLRKIGVSTPQDAMVAKFVTADNKPSTFHLTYLDRLRGKLERSRLVATPARPMGGGAVRLMPMGESGILGVAEGLETAYSAAQLHGIPVWATLNAVMLEQFEPPEGCKELYVFGDNDASYTGQAAAYSLAKRATMKDKLPTTVLIPPGVDTDWNDVLRNRGAKL